MRFSKILLAIVFLIICAAYAPLEVSIASSVNAAGLNKASDFINTKQYKRGYVSFQHMAKQGCPYSQCILGIMRQNGIGVKKSAAQAKYWFEKSAHQGFADAEHRLGLMYLNGEGIKKDLVLAKQWLTKAASQGVKEAQELLVKIPGENKVANEVAQAPQQVTGAANNIQKSWQGYSELTKQLTQLSSASQTN